MSKQRNDHRIRPYLVRGGGFGEILIPVDRARLSACGAIICILMDPGWKTLAYVESAEAKYTNRLISSVNADGTKQSLMQPPECRSRIFAL